MGEVLWIVQDIGAMMDTKSAALERPSAARRLPGSRIKLQAETVGEPGEVVEDADNVSELEATLVVESEVP